MDRKVLLQVAKAVGSEVWDKVEKAIAEIPSKEKPNSTFTIETPVDPSVPITKTQTIVSGNRDQFDEAINTACQGGWILIKMQHIHECEVYIGIMYRTK